MIRALTSSFLPTDRIYFTVEGSLCVCHITSYQFFYLTVRPGTAGLLIDIECSRVRDSSWMYLTSFVTTLIGVVLAIVQRKLPDCIAVGLQLCSARTFHVTLSPRIYKGGQGPPPKTSTPKAIQTTPQNVGYYATRGPNLSKSLCSLHHRVPEQSIPTYKPYC